jgi:GTP-binding protein
MNPPLILIHGNALNHVPDSYRRYLERAFMAAFDLRGTPVRVSFKQGRNPFAGRGKG